LAGSGVVMESGGIRSPVRVIKNEV